MRDPILYQLAIQPKVYIPVHQTNAALPTSSLRFKTSYLKQLDAMNVPQDQRPRSLVGSSIQTSTSNRRVYDPEDDRWGKAGSGQEKHPRGCAVSTTATSGSVRGVIR